MDILKEPLPGTYVLRLNKMADARGDFVKSYAHGAFAALGLPFEFREEFFSTSHRDVIRGLHFQTPPHDHVKLVGCLAGEVEDVLVDIRRGPGYGKVASVRLSAAEPLLLYIPKGIAHGFKALQDGSMMVYKTSAEYAPAHDRGIRWDSIDHDWQCAAPIVSDRDRGHPALSDFESPFGSVAGEGAR